MATKDKLLDVTIHRLFWAWAYCDHHDKSTEFMLQFMEDVSVTDLDTVLEFIESSSKDRKVWYTNNPDWLENSPQKDEYGT